MPDYTPPQYDATPPLARSVGPAQSTHPLGPVVWRVVSDRPGSLRCWAAAVLLACGGLLGVALVLKPDPRGLGTHEQLGFVEPCHMARSVGIPCPSCGMTTAFSHTVRGQLLRAARAQPMGLVLALATVMAAVLSLEALVYGRTWQLNWYRIQPHKLALSIAGMLTAAWVYKILVHTAG